VVVVRTTLGTLMPASRDTHCPPTGKLLSIKAENAYNAEKSLPRKDA
jgi:hypothetical protein